MSRGEAVNSRFRANCGHLAGRKKLTLQNSCSHGAVNPLIRFYLAKQAERRGEPYGTFQAMYHIAEDKLGLRRP